MKQRLASLSGSCQTSRLSFSSRGSGKRRKRSSSSNVLTKIPIKEKTTTYPNSARVKTLAIKLQTSVSLITSATGVIHRMKTAQTSRRPTLTGRVRVPSSPE